MSEDPDLILLASDYERRVRALEDAERIMWSIAGRVEGWSRPQAMVKDNSPTYYFWVLEFARFIVRAEDIAEEDEE